MAPEQYTRELEGAVVQLVKEREQLQVRFTTLLTATREACSDLGRRQNRRFVERRLMCAVIDAMKGGGR